MKQPIVGVYESEHDQCVALVEGGRVVLAAEEERFTRVKHNQPKENLAPERGLAWLRSEGAQLRRLAIADPHQHVQAEGTETSFHEHHLCHIALASVWSGFEDCYALALDGGGSVNFGMAARCRGTQIEVLAVDPMDNVQSVACPGDFYWRMTAALGFRPVRDEGKVMCLAAHGEPARFLPALEARYEVRPLEVVDPRYPGAHRDEVPRIDRAWLQEAGGEDPRDPSVRADWAAAAQALFERMVFTALEAHVPRGAPLVVSGGCFANVSVNRKLLDYASELFVAPAMNDGGMAAGAALLAAAAQPYRVPHVYLGPDEGDPAADPQEVARRVAEGQVVGVCAGRMEYGPRALGNRSILADPRDPKVPERLNRMLGRSGFMPFAPSILANRADEILEPGLERARHAAEFMTVAFAVREPWGKRLPAVVHADATCRPHLVRGEASPWYHAVLSAFEALTGVPALLNTSFNAHDEPIVCTREHALAALQRGCVDALVLGGEGHVREREG